MLSSLLSVTLIATLAMLSPGPDFFIVVKNTLRYPRLPALMTGFGITMAIMTHMVYCLTGLVTLIIATPKLFIVIKYIGALYLIWLGAQALLTRSNYHIAMHANKPTPVSLLTPFLQGYFCNLLNPKAALFFIALFSQLDIHTDFMLKIAYAIIIVLLSAIWWPILTLLIQHPPFYKKLSTIQNKLDKLLGFGLVILGMSVAFS